MTERVEWVLFRTLDVTGFVVVGLARTLRILP